MWKKYTITTTRKGDEMKKKLFPILLILVCSLSCLFALAACKDPAKFTVTYAVDGDSAYVVGIDGTPQPGTGVIEIAAEYEGKPLTKLAKGAFRQQGNVAGSTIPSTVTDIEEGAFMHCGFTTIQIPDSVTKIGDEAFSNCENMTSISLPNSVKTLGKSVFEECRALATVKLPSELTSCGSALFEYCHALASITLPANMTAIPGNMFQSCTSLTAVVLPDGVTEIGREAFINCTKLQSATLPAGLKKIESGAFAGCTALTQIVFKGTTEAWQKVETYGHLTRKESAYTVTCTDGTLNK